LDRIETKMEQILALVADVKESLKREMRTGFDAIHGRFDIQAARLERHARSCRPEAAGSTG
jgi:hypothetical protein